MPSKLSTRRRLATAAVWPAGVALTSWRYMWRTTPMHRRELRGSRPEDEPPPIPAGVEQSGMQGVEAGTGPLLHRRYGGLVREASRSAEELAACVMEDPNRAAPNELARFYKTRGEEGVMRVDDEFVVRMPGPWDGPVRVIDVTPTSYRVATLGGHLEAGQLEFRVSDEGRLLRVCVESWTRSGDRLSQFLHNGLLMAKEVQMHMWSSFLERVAQLAEGRLTGGLDIDTRVVEYS